MLVSGATIAHGVLDDAVNMNDRLQHKGHHSWLALVTL